MSWKTINEILGLAVTDDDFAQELLANPVNAVKQRGYRLTAEELEIFRLSASDTLPLFSQRVMRYFASSHLNQE